jgi:hypothetical protein
MRNAYYETLKRLNVTMDRATFDQATRLIDTELGVEITQAKWGEQATRQRVNAEDPQVAAAANLLRKASTPQSLFSLAGSQNGEADADARAASAIRN